MKRKNKLKFKNNNYEPYIDYSKPYTPYSKPKKK